MANDVKKEDLVQRAFELGLGTKEFLNKVSVDNLGAMVEAVEVREGTIGTLEGKVNYLDKQTKKNPKVTTVADIVKAGKIKVVGQDKGKK